MGATNFDTLQVGRFKSAREAYRNAVEEANYEYGHDSYNGTISTTSGFRMIDVPGRKDPFRYVDDIDKWDDWGISKWEACGCIEIKGTRLKKLKERNGYKGKKGIRAFYFFGWAAC